VGRDVGGGFNVHISDDRTETGTTSNPCEDGPRLEGQEEEEELLLRKLRLLRISRAGRTGKGNEMGRGPYGE